MASPKGVVRMLFTLADADLERLNAIQHRSAASGLPLNKSELVRAGILALAEMSSQKFYQTITAVDRFTPGPAVSKAKLDLNEERDALIERIKREYDL